MPKHMHLTMVVLRSVHACAGSQAKPASIAMPGVEAGKNHCQNALLHLGSTHAHFGHVQVCLLDEALSSWACRTNPGPPLMGGHAVLLPNHVCTWPPQTTNTMVSFQGWSLQLA